MSVKHDSEKPNTALVLGGFSSALMAVSEVGTFGAKKYSPNGWKTVENGKERYTSAMLRHWLAEQENVWDEESQFLHAAHLAWNALARLELIIMEQKNG